MNLLLMKPFMEQPVINLEQLLERPQGWENAPGRNWRARQLNVTPLTPADRQLLSVLSEGGDFMIPLRDRTAYGPSDRAERTSAMRNARKDRLRTAFEAHLPELQQAFPGEGVEQLIRRAQAANQRRTNIYREAHPNYYRAPPTEIEQRLYDTRTRKPNVMTKEKYLPLLNTMRGNNATGNVLAGHQSWIGRTPQTLDDQQYNDMVENFADIIGTAHMRPTFDGRLLTEASAREILGQKGYRYELEDRDNDINTPGTLRITREAYVDANGRAHPERVIAYGGYRMPDATPGQTESLMKKIHYYSTYPTKEGRKGIKMKQFLENNPDVYEKPKSRPTGTKLVNQFISDVFTVAFNAAPPKAGVPTYLKAAYNKALFAFYDVNTIAWNTIVSRVGRLYSYFYIFPTIQLPNMTPVQQLFTQSKLEDIVDNLPGDPDMQSRMAQLWPTCMFEPRIEAIVLRDYDIQAAIENYISAARAEIGNRTENGANIISRIRKILDVVVGTMFNVNYPLFIRAGVLVGTFDSISALNLPPTDNSRPAINLPPAKILSPIKVFLANRSDGHLTFSFASAQESAKLANDPTMPILPLTPIRNDKLAVSRYHGENLIETYGPALPPQQLANPLPAPELPPEIQLPTTSSAP